MDKTNNAQTPPQQDRAYEIAVDRYNIEIKHTRQVMAESQRRIERLRNETSEMMAETRAILNKLAMAG